MTISLQVHWDLLDPSLQDWLEGHVRYKSPILDPEIHAASCRFATSKSLTRRSFLTSPEGGKAWQPNCCEASGLFPGLFRELAVLADVAERSQKEAANPYNLALVVRRLSSARTQLTRAGRIELVQDLLVDLEAQVSQARSEIEEWTSSTAAEEALDLMASLVRDDLTPHWFKELIGLSRLGGEASPPAHSDDPALRDPERLVKGYGGTDLKVLAAKHLEELEACLERHRNRSRKPGRLLVHHTVLGALTTSSYVDHALETRWSFSPGVMVIPRSAEPLVAHWGSQVTSAVLRPSDTEAVLEIASTFLRSGDVTAAQALKMARGIES